MPPLKRAWAIAGTALAFAAIAAGSATGQGTATGTTPARVPKVIKPYVPPPTVRVDAGQLPSPAAALDIVNRLRDRAAPDSRERADLTWLLNLVELSRAPGGPSGRRATADRALRMNAWWYSRRRAPDDRVIARDPDGVLLTYRRGHGFIVNPVATMGRWRDLNIAWTAPQLADDIAPMMTVRSYAGSYWGALEYYDVPGEPDAVEPGVSAMGQGRAAALFGRAWKMSGNPAYARAAILALNGFRVPVNMGGVANVVRYGGKSGPWYPERAYPGKNPWYGAALNGFMATLIGLRGSAGDLAAVPHVAAPADQGDGTGTTGTAGTTGAADPDAVAQAQAASALARTLADRGVETLIKFLPLHDSGEWSYYGMLTPGHAWRTNLADLNYHCYHVHLLRSLDTMYPGRGLGQYAARWQRDVDRRGARCPAR